MQASDRKFILAKIHDNAVRQDFVPIFKLDAFPTDGKYHWHKINTTTLTVQCGLWSKVYIWVPLNWAVLPPPGNAGSYQPRS